MNKINNIATLIKVLNKAFPLLKEDKLDILKPLLENYIGNDWEKLQQYSSERYTRNILEKNKYFELVLICWNKNQCSPWHNHPEQGCLMKILQGTIIETRGKEKVILETKFLNVDEISYIHDSVGFHKIENSDKNSVSLHLYAPGEYSCRFHEALDKFKD